MSSWPCMLITTQWHDIVQVTILVGPSVNQCLDLHVDIVPSFEYNIQVVDSFMHELPA